MQFPSYLSRFAIGVLLLIGPVFERPLGFTSLAQKSKDDDAIRVLVERLFELYQRKDINGMISLWSEKSPVLAENKKSLQKEFTAFEKIVVKGFDIRQMKIDGDKANLRVAAELSLTRAHMVKPAEKQEKKTRTIDLVNEDGNWKVWKLVASEEELAAAIIAAETEEARKALMEKESDLVSTDLAEALIHLNGVDVAYKRGYQHALAINRLAYKLADEHSDQFVMANVLINAGRIYGHVGAPEKSHELAMEYFQKGLKIGEDAGFKEIMSRAQINIALIYTSLAELALAADYYRKGLKLAEEVGDYDLTIWAMNNLSTIYRAEGNYTRALELMLKCLKMSESRLETGADWRVMAAALYNIGSVFSNQGNDEQSLAYLQRSYNAVEKAVILGNSSAKITKAEVLAAIGGVYLQKGDDALAMDYYQKSLKLTEEFESTVTGYRDSFVAYLKVEIGDVLKAQKKTDQAIENYHEALKLVDKSRDRAQKTFVLLSLSEIHILNGNHREGLVFAERALEIAQQISRSLNTPRALVIRAKAYQKLGQPEEAYQQLAKAIDVTEQLRKQLVGGETDRQRSFEGAMVPYYAMIDLQVGQKRFNEAFTCAQRAKGRTLLELLQNGRVNLYKSASPAEREQEQQLSRKIISLNRQITIEKLKSQLDGKRLGELEEQLKKARLEFEAFQTALYATHPDLKVHRGEIQPVSFDDASGMIPDSKTALLDFIVTDENIHLFVLTKDSTSRPALNTYTLMIERKALAEKVERFRRRMENRDYDFQKLSHELYDLLIKPAEKQLQNRTNLIISPDNVLWDLPFQTLLSPESRYLIEDAAISYAPSLSVLREMQLASRKKQPLAKTSLLALGNPELRTRSKELVKFVKMDAELQPLPEAAAQVRALERLYGKTFSKVLTDSAAREELVKEQSSRYRILHLATHGILNDVSPMYSHVMLSQTPGKDDEDGLLEAWEMMNLDLNADLVVLAACETARGRVGVGEGVIGMSWTLFVAGCPRTVVSQWKVEASSTTVLMVEFHKNFKTRYGRTQPAVSTAEAMRQATLKVMKNPEFVHPFYWGGFVVVGDGN